MNTPTTLSKQELSYIKHTLFDMLQSSGKLDYMDYLSLAETLDELSFKAFSTDDYTIKLIEIIDLMIDLDSIGFDMGQLYKFSAKLK